MRVVLVTSQVNYVKDNYCYIIDRLTDRENLSPDIEIAGLVLQKTFTFRVFIKTLSLFLVGAPGIGLTLLRNIWRAFFADRRVAMARERGIPVFYFDTVNAPGAIEAIRKLEPDLILNLRTRDIYRKAILSLPKIGCINVHHGILPENRGTMCDLWAWYEGRPVGFSVHWMNRKIDDGEILAVAEVDVKDVKSYVEIPYRSSIKEAQVVKEVLERIAREGKVPGIPNRSENIRYTRNPGLLEILAMRRKGLRL